jgi:uncharacterized membrane protein YcaP (DUF421 family)
LDVANLYNLIFPETPVLELLVRTSAIYLVVVIAIRLLPKRQAGSLSPHDVMVLVLMGGLTSKAMEGESKSATEYLFMICVLLFWGYVFSWLAHRFPRLRPLQQENPTPLVQHGRLLRRNMQREIITEEELLASLRKEGISDITEVRQAILEADGQISVIKYDKNEADHA